MSGWGAPAASGLFPGLGFGTPAAPVDEEAVIEDDGGAAITPQPVVVGAGNHCERQSMALDSNDSAPP